MKYRNCTERLAHFLYCFIVSLIMVFTWAIISYAEVGPSSFKAENIPAYTGQPYVEIYGNVPDFNLMDLTTDEYISFGILDSLGRTSGASACLGPGTLPTGSRGSIGTDIRPSGFQLDKYPSLIDDPAYLFNRCHVIGFQLCGDVGSPQNLFTGTRYLNVTGMLPFENQVTSCISSMGYHVIYRATPIYRDNNLVADGIQLEAYSVEDSGKSVKFNVFAYNVQPGVVIDYKTGKNAADPNYTAAAAESEILRLDASEPESSHSNVSRSLEKSTTEATNAEYILNTNTKKFHYPWCSSVSDMKAKNKKEFSGSRDDVISSGYVPCKRCNP